MEGGGKLARPLLAPHAVQHEEHRTCVIHAGLLLADQTDDEGLSNERCNQGGWVTGVVLRVGRRR